MNEYRIPKPTFPIAARVLAGAVVVGLTGLGLVAYEVFRLIDNPIVAGAFALVIELGAISEALSILRGNHPAKGGLAISLVVSGLYNYVRADQVAASLDRPVEGLFLWALAIGPLSAVLFLSLALGHELREHEQRVQAWEINRQRWLDDQAEREARRQERREARQERLSLSVPQPAMTVTTPVNDTANGSYGDFLAVMAGRNGSGPLTAAEIQQQFGVSERTAWRWLARYKDSHLSQVREEN